MLISLWYLYYRIRKPIKCTWKLHIYHTDLLVTVLRDPVDHLETQSVPQRKEVYCFVLMLVCLRILYLA